MVKDVNQIYCGDCFAIYRNSESLFYTPEANIKLYVNYISFWKTAFLISKKKKTRQVNRGKKIAFSGNGAETTGYPHANE